MFKIADIFGCIRIPHIIHEILIGIEKPNKIGPICAFILSVAVFLNEETEAITDGLSR